jgi:putative ABC transport system ATP-binding protein
MLEMHNIRKSFRTDTVETRALKDVVLHVGAGEFLAILGPSGSGKSTFLNVAGLLEEADAGRYVLDGVDVSKLSDDQRSQIRNEKIGFIFQGFNLITDLNVYDNVEVPLRYRDMRSAERHRRVVEVLDRVGLGGRMKHYPGQLSGGQQQRVAIARALAGRPSVILADEPTGNLDTEMSEQVMEILRSVNASGTTIVMVTHNLELAARAHRRVQMVDGQLMSCEPSQEPMRATAPMSH